MERVAFQGVTNIVRFNWHFYVIAIVSVAVLLFFNQYLIAVLAALSMIVSLAVSWYVYDYSGLYTLNWLDITSPSSIVNINAGFDETSVLLADKYPSAKLTVLDFYDPLKHMEVSIERARKAYGAYPGTRAVSTAAIPSAPADFIFIALAAHEIRDRLERQLFFSQLRENLEDDGKIVVLEHLRDLPNFMAYNIGFFHFFSKKEWIHTFESAGLTVYKETKITPFLSAFILIKNGVTS